ncbi:uncharacterized protein T551_02341 [Pneumocystis jirovecii RU7]|uniref:Pre-mRNA-splicing factor 38 n=1 Tax=Pneumocystis jirovecii (strain RU7) TaxID=1408657 RepID=A0A0W4ZL05_PNEJ7|nr:uncharacterized protein T551_02341 [Pneumocystis jirovecii RU7]KTW29067.1 hypothetical protein T551_02341 [Pneumocystis jirovecii RU7]
METSKKNSEKDYIEQSVHSMNPTNLIEKIIRERVLDCRYYKEMCFGLTAATICDRAVRLKCIGGQYLNQRPTEFLCLAFKLLQLQPEKEIVLEYLYAKDFKYLQALAAFYIRLTFPAKECYIILEPFLSDYRKLRIRHSTGSYGLTYIDEFIDHLLNEERVCDIALPRLPTRFMLEEMDELEPRKSAMEDELENGKD